VPTAKTGKEVRIPLHPHVRAIIAKYQGGFPSGISNQKQNKYIKEVAALIPALQEQVMSGRTQGGKHVEEASPKGDLVTTHTARRSFATNLYQQGIPARTIMTVTGHSTERAFMRYIRLSVDEHMDLIANSTLFSSTSLRVA
jgi:integrase